MLVEVFQLKDFSKTTLIMFSSEKADLVNELFENNEYECVAVMVPAKIEIDDILEHAYYLTNTIEEPWYNNPGSLINVSEDKVKGCRSTSVGDVIKYNGNKYLVDKFGFTKI